MAVASVIAVFILWGWVVREWATLSEGESGSASLRNMALVFGGPIAVGLAVWRSIVAQKQAAAAQKQVAVSEQDSLDRQLQGGIALLGNADTSVRIGGSLVLYFLASNHLDRYGAEVCEVLQHFSETQATRPENDASSRHRSTYSALGGLYVGPADGMAAAQLARRLSDAVEAAGGLRSERILPRLVR